MFVELVAFGAFLNITIREKTVVSYDLFVQLYKQSKKSVVVKFCHYLLCFC